MAFQSETTAPVKPHSSRRRSVSSHRFSAEGIPLILLYADMTVAGDASVTTRSKAGR